MTDSTPLPAIDPDQLTRVVRAALRRDAAEIADWEIVPLTDGLGGFGVYRVSGHAHTRDGALPWTVVLKTLERDPEHDDPHGWNYWQREALLYASGILDHVPPGLRPARCFLVEDRLPDSRWLWLELLTDVHAGRWPRTRYRLVGERLGRFNGAFLTGQALPSEPWLQGPWLRSYVDWHGPPLTTLPQHLDHPLVRQAWPAASAAGVLQLWKERDTLLDALDRLPQTFCHHDVFVRNLYLRPNGDDEGELIAIDWAFAGRGAIGEEVAIPLASGLGFFDVAPREAPALDRELFAGYLTGLAACGWHGDPRQARLGYTAAFALHCGLAWVGINLLVLLDNDEQTLEVMCQKVQRRSLAEALDNLRQITTFALQLGDEARQLLHLVS